MQREQQQPQVIVIQQESKWLRRLVLFLLFGWFYPLIVALRWSIKLSWRLFVTYPVKWSIALTRWTWRGSVALIRWSIPAIIVASHKARAGVAWFHRRYGWRGWAIVAAVYAAIMIVAFIIGKLAQ